MQDGQAASLLSGSTEALEVRPRAAQNRLLRCIPDGELTLLRSIATEVELKPRQVLHHWRLPMDHVYFVERGLISVSAKVEANRFVEAWLVGSEGMIGAPCVLAPEDPTPPALLECNPPQCRSCGSRRKSHDDKSSPPDDSDNAS